MNDSTTVERLLVPPASRILMPGLPARPRGRERYQVAGGGTMAVRVQTGDRIALRDMEGGQPCELAFIGPGSRPDVGLLGADADCKLDGLRACLEDGSEGAARTRAALAAAGVDLAGVRGVRFFSATSLPGSRVDLTACEEGLLLLAAPSAAMEPGSNDTATPVELVVERARLANVPEMPLLPDPLADPLQDIRIASATAQVYFVRAEEYIQIIDVEGRQCTDFQCFSARKLDQGRALALDATATRTLTARAYPSPGHSSKAFDADFEPLVEVVRDTCGRHDTFVTACNPRYYDDLGYPGHVNCTENYNGALDPYGIAPRRGWEALNYFNNTFIDAHNQLYLDEPWSRPGDYILMRALTDLVCVTSACPDDVDPANGWNPTDIHVRTYSDKNAFSNAMGFRMTPDADAELTRKTAFHPRFSAMTRNMQEYNGYWLPSRFNNRGAVEEYFACRERVAVMDLSPLRKFEVTGPDAENLLQYCLTRDIRRISVGQVVYTAMCYETGGMIDDGTVFRLADNNFRWICGDDRSGIWLREQAQAQGYKAWVRSSTDQLQNIAVQGPRSRELLAKVIWAPPTQPSLQELGWFRFLVGRIGSLDGVPVVVSRTGYTGELGYEVFCHPRDALAVFEAVWDAGLPLGISPLGMEALDMLRIESGLAFAGHEFDDQTDPFEAGIGFTVPLKSKQDDFIGREALVRRKEHPRSRLVGLDLEGNEAVSHGDPVMVGRGRVGIVTSATRSPVLRKTIALVRVDLAHAEPGTPVHVGKLDGQQKRLPATVVRFPHFDPEKTRPRS